MSMILYPDEQTGGQTPINPALINVGATGLSNQDMGMISTVLDINNEKRILLNDGSTYRLLIGDDGN